MRRFLIALVAVAALIAVPSAGAAVPAKGEYGIAFVKSHKSTVGFTLIVRLQHVKNCHGTVRATARLGSGRTRGWSAKIVDNQFFCAASIKGSLPNRYYKKRVAFRFSQTAGGTFKNFRSVRSFRIKEWWDHVALLPPSGGRWSLAIMANQTNKPATLKSFAVDDYGNVDGSSFSGPPWSVTMTCNDGTTQTVPFLPSGSSPLGLEGSLTFSGTGQYSQITYLLSYTFGNASAQWNGLGVLLVTGYLTINGARTYCVETAMHQIAISWDGNS